MKPPAGIGRATPEGRRFAWFDRAWYGGRDRFDVVWFGLILLVVTTIFGVPLLLVGMARHQGWFQVRLLHHLPDYRILENVRENLPKAPILAAAHHADGDRLYVSQKGGAIHAYDLSNGLWTTERPEVLAQMEQAEVVALRGGSGRDPRAAAAALPAQERPLWAITAGEGLLVREGGRWSSVITDTVWNGPDGQPVRPEDVRVAAVSEDRRWLALGTGGQGLGLYDTTGHRWVKLDKAWQAKLPALEINHLVFTQGLFWAGTRQGLVVIAPGDAPAIGAVAEFPGEILSLAVGKDGVIALQRQSPTGALRLGEIKAPKDKAAMAMVEKELFGNLSLASWHHAAFVADQLWLAGKGGLHRYDPQLRQQTGVDAAAIYTVLPTPEGFVYGAEGGVGRVSGGNVVKWSAPNESIVAVQAGASGMAPWWGVGASGRVFSWDDTPGTVATRFDAQTTALDPKDFTGAMALGPAQVVLLGPKGALLHDVEQRTYQDFPTGKEPALDRLAPGLKSSFATEQFLYGVRQVGSGPSLLTMWPLAEARKGVFTPVKPVEDSLGSLLRARRWGAGGVFLHATGSLTRIQEGGGPPGYSLSVICQPSAEMAGVKLLDVQPTNEGLIATTGTRVGFYSEKQRGWSRVLDLPKGEWVQGITGWANRILVRTARQRVFEITGDAAWTAVLDPTPWKLTDETLSSALLEGGRLHLAGPGRVESYDLGQRTVVNSAELEGRPDAPRLLGTARGVPVLFGGEQVYLGGNIFDPNQGRVLSASLDGALLLTVRELEGRRFLRTYDLGKGQIEETLFRRPTTGAGIGQLLDAVVFDERRIAVATDGGLRFYDVRQRTWIEPEHRLLARGGRVFRLGAHLMLAESLDRDSFRLTFLSDAGWTWPGPHDDKAAKHSGLQNEVVRSYAVDPASDSVAMLLPDGRVVRWQKGRVEIVLGAPTDGPPAAAWKRVFLRGEGADAKLFCTTERSAWCYAFAGRTWREIILSAAGALPPWREIALEADGDDERVTARDGSGRWFTGTFPRAGAAEVVLTELARPEEESGFGADPGRLVTAAQGGGGTPWRFVMEDRIRRYDPRRRAWLPDVPVPGAAGTEPRYGRVRERHVVLAADGARAWIAGSDGGDPESFVPVALNPAEPTFLDAEGGVWKFRADHVYARSRPEADRRSYGEFLPLTDPPLRLSPEEVRSVRRWGDVLLWSTVRGPIVWDEAKHAVQPTPPALGTLGAFDEAFVADNVLWLRAGRGLLRFAGDMRELTLRDCDQVLVDHRARVWALVQGGWRVWTGREFQPVSLPPGGRLFVAEAGVPCVLDAAGVPRRWEPGADPVSVAPLPEGFVAMKPDFMVPDESDGWWLRLGGEWVHLRAVRRWRELPPVPRRADARLARSWQPGPLRAEPMAPTAWRTRRFGWAVDYELTERRAVYSDAAVRNTLPEDSGAGGTGRRTRRMLDDVLAEVRGRFAPLANGTQAYDPVLRIEVIANGDLMAVRPSRSLLLGERAGRLSREALADAPVLKTNWLEWEASRRVFLVQGVKQRHTLTPAQAVKAGSLFFERIDALLVGAGGRTGWANAHGLWLATSASVRLDQGDLRFDPQPDLPAMLTGAHGALLGPAGDFSLGSDWERRPAARHQVDCGPLRLVEERGGGVTATLNVPGSSMAALNGTRFAWDDPRLNVAFGDDGIWLQTEAGLVSAQRWGRWERLPVAKGRLYSERSGATWFQAGDRWYERTGSQWSPLAQDPLADRELARLGAWRWSSRAHAVDVTIDGAPLGFAVKAGRTGVGFTADQLVSAAAMDGRRWVASAAFWETARAGTSLGGLTAARRAGPGTGDLEAHRDAGGAWSLFLRRRDGVARWDEGSGNWIAAIDPRQEWALAATDRLRFSLRGGRMAKEFLADHPGGGSTWVPYTFERGCFPFDLVSGFWSDGTRLYLATRAGLLIHEDKLALLPGAVRGWWLPAGGGPQAALAVGRPAGETRLVANFARGGLTSDNGRDFVPASAHAGAWARWADHLWRWQISASGEAEVAYRKFKDTWVPMPEALGPQGRFPHDDLADVVWFPQGGAFLWRNGWISVAADDGLAVSPDWRHFDLRSLRPRALLALDREVPWEAGRTLPAGLYVCDERDAVWSFANGAWLPVAPAELAAALAAYAKAPPVLQRARLRLTEYRNGSDRRLQFGQRALDGTWRPLSWQPVDQRWALGLDRWTHLAPAADGLWAATPAGFALYRIGKNQRLEIDPDQLVVVRAFPADGSRVTDLKPLGAQWLARWEDDSNRIFQGSLARTKDTGAFDKSGQADEFAERELVSQAATGFWSWRLTGRRNHDAGRLEGRLHGEEIHYQGGRFGFDAFTAVRTSEPERWDILTLAEGWYRIPAGDLNLRRQVRPLALVGVDPAMVRQLYPSHDGRGPVLAVGDERNRHWKIRGARAEPVERRLDYFGEDDFWRYAALAGRLTIVPKSDDRVVGGAAERRLEKGRFTDDRVAGFPVRVESRWWIPTMAGVVEWSKPGVLDRIHAPPFAGVAGEAVPRALYLRDGPQVGYAGGDGLRALDARRELWPLPHLTLPPEGELYSVEAGPRDTLRWRWRTSAGNGWVLASSGNPPWKTEGVVPLDFSLLPLYTKRLAGARPLPGIAWLDFSQGGKGQVWQNGAATPQFDFEMPPQPGVFRLLEVIVSQERVIVVGDNELFEMEVEAIARKF